MGGAVAGWPLAARAQQPTGKAARIGYLNIRSPVSTDEAFLQGLRELGWIEGQNIFIEWRYAAGSSDRLKEFAGELVRLKVDVIVAAAFARDPHAPDPTHSLPPSLFSH